MGYSIWVSKESDTTERLLLSLPRLSKHIEDGKGLIKKCYHIFPEAFLVAFLSSRAVDSGGRGEKKRQKAEKEKVLPPRKWSISNLLHRELEEATQKHE